METGNAIERQASALSRRRLLAGVGAAMATVIAPPYRAFAQEATPLASPSPALRDWRGELWVGSWSAAPHSPFPAFEEMPSQRIELDDQTVRQIVRTTIGGDQLRVRFANTFGDRPLVIGAARVALRERGAAIDPASDRPLTFGGSSTVTVPAGALVLSDPVPLPVSALTELAISIHFPEPTSTTTVHGFAFQTNFISPPGSFVGEQDMPIASTVQSWFFLTGVDVLPAAPAGAIIAFGDSITDGAFSTPDTNRRWPDVLAERLFADAAAPPMGVLNQGIGGNRILYNGTGEFEFAFGPNALARFDRDVLAQPGVTHLIVLEGINDIGLPIAFGLTDQVASADQIISGLAQLAERAHEHGVAAFGGTLTPFEGAMYFSSEGEATRQAVNEWIRTSTSFDAAIDFDAAVRDPGQPNRILPEFDSGDHLHPNDAGFRAMGEAIDLGLFRS